MKRTTMLSTTLVAVALAFPLAATAADDLQRQEPPGATSGAQDITPPGQAGDAAFASEQTGKNGVRFVTGGVGESEQSTLRQRYGDFSLMLVNATSQQGAYVADVAVSVRDAAGNEIIGTTTDGPWLIADLPPGRYTVDATYNGTRQSRSINVGGQGQQRMVMTWAEGAS